MQETLTKMLKIYTGDCTEAHTERSRLKEPINLTVKSPLMWCVMTFSESTK